MFLPLVTSSYSQRSRAYAEQPFQTLLPPQSTFDAPVPLATAVPAPFSTLGPGQYFEEDNHFEVSFIEEGGEQFGYGPLKDNPGLYAMWVTDDNGTHYFVVPKGDDSLLGDRDPVTKNREDNGFKQFILDRDKVVEDIQIKQDDIHAKEDQRDTKYAVSGLIIGGGLIVCFIFTGGACGIAIAIAAPATPLNIPPM